jgi:hypothetical protein
MTTTYDRKEINSTHLVAFSKPKPVINLHYYIPETKEWRRCKVLDNLPYSLVTLCLDNEVEGDNNKVFVTTLDSYRISTKPEDENFDYEYEKSWRDSLTRDSEVDIKINGTWTKGQVCWMKSDIIEGVCNIGNRTWEKNVKVTCNSHYIYKDSRLLAKSCTYTEPVSEKQLEEEEEKRQEKEDIERISEELEKRSTKYKHRFSTFKWSDTLTFYQGLNKRNEEVKVEDIRQYLRKGYEESKLVPSTICLIWLKMSQDDVCFTNVRQDTSNGNNEHKLSNDADGIFDIKVFGATYARYKIPTSEHIKAEEFHTDTHIDLVNEGDCHVLKDATYESPIFKGNSIYQYIETDGIEISYNELYIDEYVRDIKFKTECKSNPASISWVGNNVIAKCHNFGPTFFFKKEDIIKLKNK